MAKNKVIFYYDGFNFYRGIKEVGWKNCYWLDLYKFSQRLISKYDDYEIVAINYFTARPLDEGSRIRQGIWIKANESLHPEIEFHFGKYKPEEVICPKCSMKIQVPKEKQTDVNIAVNLMFDCMKKNCNASFLISGDNDLLPALKCISKNYSSQKIHIAYPPKRNRSSLHEYSKFSPLHLLNSKQLFLESLLNNSYNFEDGTWAIKPIEWQ
ncbi:MAG: NYN domain-containing protein [Bacteroidetes bacterium]|nr:NYN domain-containing protein [Bacteroidota bacterium]MBU1720282.1 NYN domain-containing protein [Bacteroidota bacterium]